MLLIIQFATIAFGQNRIDYYKKINEGKVFAIRNEFDSAVYAYQEVFENYQFVFARDCYNAIELSVLAKDSNKFEFFIEKALLQGIQISDLQKSDMINAFLSSTLYEKLETREDSLHSVYSERINWELRKEVTQMFIEDQKIREKYYNAKGFEKKKIEKEWEELNARQVERIIEITEEFGFPGEKIIGLDRTSMHSKIRTQNFSCGMPIVLFLHHFSQPNPSFDELLLEEVKKGNLYNEHFAAICDFEAKFGKNKHPIFGYFGLQHQPRGKLTKEMNDRREKVAILSIEQLEELNRVKGITKFWKRLY